jgi:hypothetical protein
MTYFRLPLSGNVWQDINPFRWVTGRIGQFSLFSVNLGRSANPDVEEAILDVASYGRQLGRIGEALTAVIDRLDGAAYSNEQEAAIEGFKVLMREIDAAKRRALRDS